MINLFRKIRQSLLPENSLSKYFLYAIGEIALVMIGILLALQVNNWNENRKERIKEQEVLLELNQSININLETFKSALQAIKRNQKSSEIIIHHLSEQLPYQDSLDYHFTRAIPIGLAIRGKISTSGYKALESEGYDILTNKQLRVEVINLFETVLPTIIQPNEDYAKWYNTYLSDAFREFLELKDNVISPIDYEGIQKAPYFRSMVEHRLRQKRQALRLIDEVIEEMEPILGMIQLALNK